jgi:hypothetical protein
MADVNINIFTNKVYKQGASTVVPGFIEGEEPTPINPSGSGGASEFVPYVGATENFDLGEFGMSAGFLKLDTTPTNTPTDQGTMYWDEDDNTVDIILNGYIMKVGEDLFYPVKNQTGSSIAKGTNVGFAGTLGMSGRLLITPYLANGANPTSRYMGVTAETIANGDDGKVLWFGRVRGINTNAFNEGDILYASTSSAGAFQTTLPVAPNNIVEVAAVVTKSSTQGVIFVRPQFLSSGSKWTDVTGGIYRDGAVAIGSTTIPTNATFSITSKSPINNAQEFIQYFTSNGVKSFVHQNDGATLFLGGTSNVYIGGGPIANNWGLLIDSSSGDNATRFAFRVRSQNINTDFFSVFNNGRVLTHGAIFQTGSPSTNQATHGVTFRSSANANDSFTQFVLTDNLQNVSVRFAVGGKYEFIDRRLWVGNPNSPISNGSHFKGNANNTSVVFQIDNSSNTALLKIRGDGDIEFSETTDLILGTTTGTKIGTATTQKIGFWNATPIAQPTTAIAESAFVENAGGTAVNDDSTFDGYTLRQVVKALRDAGLLA